MSRYEDAVFERITELVSLLSQADEDLTVKKIASVTDATLEQTREDLFRLHHCGIQIAPSKAVEQLNRYESRFDDTPLTLISEIPGDPALSAGILFLNPVERSLFRQQEVGQIKIKDTPTSVPVEVTERVEKIRQAIRESSFVRFRYRRAGAEKAETVEIAPRMLYFNATDDLYYCISLPENSNEIIPFRLDRIVFGVQIVAQKAVSLDPADPRPARIRYVWGSDFSSEDTPVHVKVRIEPNTANILNKIRSDISGRSFASLYEKDGYYYYEDEIIGLTSFRSWLMTFGSSVKVLEPKETAESLLASSRQRLENYEDGMRFHPISM